MDDALKNKLDALLALSSIGVGGEAVNAEEALNRLLEKHGLQLEDICDESKGLVEVELKYRTALERRLISQILLNITQDLDLTIYKTKGIKEISCMVTTSQRAEIVIRYDLFRRDLKNQMNTLYRAFLIKNKIFSPARPDEEEREMSTDDYNALQMARGIDRVNIHKQLESK